MLFVTLALETSVLIFLNNLPGIRVKKQNPWDWACGILMTVTIFASLSMIPNQAPAVTYRPENDTSRMQYVMSREDLWKSNNPTHGMASCSAVLHICSAAATNQFLCIFRSIYDMLQNKYRQCGDFKP